MRAAGRFNAFTDEDLSLDGAESGPLVGTTFAVKDLYDIAGTVAACVNPDWGRTHSVATEHAKAVSTSPPATAAADPLDDPPQTCPGAFGLMGVPK